MSDAFTEWEYIIAPTPREGAQPGLRRIAVHSGWLYQVEGYELLSGAKVITRCWQPPVFVPLRAGEEHL